MSAGRTALLIDFGSTYTKLRAVDLDQAKMIGSGQGPSTVATDIGDGLRSALADLEANLGALPEFTYRLASSSAAGGLSMVTVGLVRELTAEAARLAALGAGARLVGTFAYRLTDADIADIERLAPDIVLLAGGTDGGNDEVVRANAERLAAAQVDCPVVYAGNRTAADAVADRLDAAGIAVSVTDNVMPEFNVLEVEPARAAIRQIFIERIVHAKGMDAVSGLFDGVLMPTPAAVLDAARLLADGTDETPGLGALVVADVGGATTDVHSIADGAPGGDDVVRHGLPEPYAMRTVEGDLGMRAGAAGIVEAGGAAALAERAGLPPERIGELVSELGADVERLPASDDEKRLDAALARTAVSVAMRRHAGKTRIVQTVTGPIVVQDGKDLGRVATVIGTGGVLAGGADPAAILGAGLADPDEPHSLRPDGARLLLDRDYLLFAVGLLAGIEPEAALRLGLNGLRELKGEAGDGRHTAA